MQATKTVLDARNIKTDDKEFEETCKRVTNRIFKGSEKIEIVDI